MVPLQTLIEPKHGIIRAIYLQLKDASPGSDSKSLVTSATRITNEIYGSDELSSLEFLRG